MVCIQRVERRGWDGKTWGLPWNIRLPAGRHKRFEPPFHHPTSPCKQEFSYAWPIRVAAPDALVGPMWSQHGSVRFEVPVTFLVEPLLVNCSHLVRDTHEVHFPHFAGWNIELHNRAWASANHVPIDF